MLVCNTEYLSFSYVFESLLTLKKNGNYNPLKYFDMQIIQKEGG